MKHLGIAVIVIAVVASACGSGVGDEPTGARNLPIADGATSPNAVIDPGDGIGDGSEGGDLPVVSPELSSEIDLAMSDLSSRFGDDRLIGVTSAFELTWPDSALGCPEPGAVYAQALVDGYRIQLTDGEESYVYHGAAGEAPFLCESSR